MHIFQTQKINLEVNAITDQLLTIMQQDKWKDLPAFVTPQCPQEGSKPGYWTPTYCQKQQQQKMQHKWQVPNEKKNSQIESKLIQVLQWKDKRQKERDQYDLKQSL